MEHARVKCSLIGNFAVGKTSIIRTLLDRPVQDPETTLGIDFFTKTISYGGQSVHPYGGQLVHLSIWDTAGSERFHSLMHAYLRDAVLIIIVYDTTNPESNILQWMRIVEQHSPKVVGILGNKTDLTSVNCENFDDLLFPWSRQNLKIVRGTCSARDSDSVKLFFKRCLKEVLQDESEVPILTPIRFETTSTKKHTCCT